MTKRSLPFNLDRNADFSPAKLAAIKAAQPDFYRFKPSAYVTYNPPKWRLALDVIKNMFGL